MKINPNDYPSVVTRRKALDQEWEFGTALPIYLNKVEYDLDRSCDARDYFIGVLTYQAEGNEMVLEDGYQGFTGYDNDMPDPEYRITIDGTRTIGIVEAVGSNTYTPGTDVNITITDDSGSDALWSNSAAITIKGFTSSDFTGTAVVSKTFTLSNNAASGVISMPDSASGEIYLLATTSDSIINEVYLKEEGGDTGVTASDVIANLDTVQDYYDPDDATADITVTITPLSGITLSDYNATITVIESGTLNTFAVQTAATLPSSVTFSLDDMSLYAADYDFQNSLEVSIVITGQ